MSARSPIEWTDDTWNPTAGCSVHSPGCTNCYAMKRVAPRLAANPATPHYAGTVRPSKAGPVFTGVVNLAGDAVLTKPLRWKKPRMIFVNSTSDLFHENVPDAWIDRVFAVMALAPQHTFQVLTKRAERMREYMTGLAGSDVVKRCERQGRLMAAARLSAPLPAPFTVQIVTPILHEGAPGQMLIDHFRMRHICDNARAWPLPNVWLGVSAEDQTRADERIPHLLATPAAVRFVSAEPLLGPIDLSPWLFIVTHEDETIIEAGKGEIPVPFHDPATTDPADIASPRLDQIIVGGESGKDARPMHPAWVRSIRDQCAAAQVPFFFKQWGEWTVTYSAGKDGATHWIMPDGTRRPIVNGEDWPPDALPIARVGKKRAGRLLDGVEHNGMPAIREVPAL